MQFFIRRDFKSNRAEFYFDLAMSLEDRIPLITTLRRFEARANQRSRARGRLYQDIIRKAANGSIAEGLRGLVPATDLVVIDCIQNSDDLNVAKGFYSLADTVEKTDLMRKKLVGSITYPVIILIVFAMLIYGFSFNIVPVLETVQPPEQWPGLGQLMYGLVTSVRQYGWLMCLVVVGILTLFFWSLGSWCSHIRVMVDRFPPFNVYRDFTGSMAIIAIAAALGSGVSLRAAIERCIVYANPWLSWHLQRVVRNLADSESTNFGDSFNTGFLGEYMLDRVAQAGERRNPVKAFVKIATGSIDRVASSIDRSAKTLNMVLLLLCGVVLMILMGGFMQTALELSQSITNTSTN